MSSPALRQLLANLLTMAEGNDPAPSPEAAALLQDFAVEPDRFGVPALSTDELVALASGGIEESDLPRIYAALRADPLLLDEALLLLEQIGLVQAERDRAGAPEDEEGLTRESLAEYFAGRRQLTSNDRRLLLRDPAVRAVYEELKTQQVARLPGETSAGQAFRMPALAAASSDREVEQRSFPGGSARITPSHRGDRVYVNFSFDLVESVPARFLIEREDREAQTLETAVVDLLRTPGKATVQLVLSADDQLVRLLRAPDANGTFLKE